MRQRPLIERAMSQISIHPETGCWIWSGHLSLGYGRAKDIDRYVGVHRYFYELVRNEGKRLPREVHIHHECEERRCCNPQHLRALTIGEHALHHGAITKAIARSADLHRAQTHCKRGHEFTKENTRVKKNGSRVCRACERARWGDFYRSTGGYTHKQRPAPLWMRIQAGTEESAKPQEARGH